MPGRHVVVGLDFSPSGQDAVEYAARLAARYRAPLTLIHAHINALPGYTGIGMPVPYIPGQESVLDWIDSQLKQTVESVRGIYDGDIDVRRVIGRPAGVLIRASRDALVTVVGARGAGGFSGLLLGSVSSQVAAHAHGPVIVVRPPEMRQDFAASGPVLVGYDGSAESGAALEFAAAEAYSRRASLKVVNVYWAQPWLDDDTRQQRLAAAENLVEQAIATCRDEYLALDLQPLTVLDPSPEHALIEASKGAALTVVGCRGRGGLAGMLLGSVSWALTHHAQHPVAVVHPAGR
ncbi:universal stress protein [Catelliglobosispora koreensis]|uniref:universal stress protein n=1 Tax=Catelliglobosispora koreensis TaxID=129052 RepID=UPI0005904D62|nr:universal stress protein [Catelliglobosispora koreensis]